jgi:NAD(P)-dependent dehydrogenase (short-subunit alcohol dehydrogenase family)
MGSANGLLDGRVALVTGGARGIGFEVGARLAAAGAAVVLADITEGPVGEAAERLRTDGARAAGVVMDVTDEASVAAGFDEAEAALGAVDVLVANAGVLVLERALDLSVGDFRRVVDVNLTGSFLTCAEGARRMLRAGRGGRIIISSSLFGLRGGVENTAYSSSKFGVIGLAQCLAAELGEAGITVNAVCPGQVDTVMIRDLIAERARLTGSPAEEVEQAMLARIPSRRMARPEEVADTYVWLASDMAGYVTGQSIVVDGGWQLG